jgi:hypothetical protein
VVLELIFKALKTIFYVGFGRKVIGDGDPKLPEMVTHGWVMARPNRESWPREEAERERQKW